MKSGLANTLPQTLMLAIATFGLLLILVSADQPGNVTAIQHRMVAKSNPALTGAAGSAVQGAALFEFNTTNNNAALQYHAVARRWMAQEATPEVFGQYRFKGERILDLMFTPKDEIST